MPRSLSRSIPRTGYLIGPGHTFRTITEKIAGIVLTRSTPAAWFAGFTLSFLALMLLFYAVYYLLVTGVGIWGNNIPVAWGYDITNLVWWIGIGHAGTLISAILLLFHQQWRTSINRFAEAMTLFAVLCASLFPLLHTGRPWLAYWIFPYPNTLGLWPQFRSPLVWDAFAIGTYATVSLIFWYIGLIPDLAALRDRARNTPVRLFYGLLALGWRGAAHHWQRYETAYLLLAALATPLVVSVHSVVSFDFAVSVIPGWHSTIFPPYFVAGAIFSGFAMVLTLLLPLRSLYRLQDFITPRHLDNMAKVMLATGLFVAYGYLTEAFTAWYSGNPAERFWLFNRSFGPYWWAFWALMACNVVAPQALWFARVRVTPVLLFAVALIINFGMWLERYVIIVVSLHRDYLPSSWGIYAGTIWDRATLLGTIGLFLTLIFIFVRLLPMISIFEMRHLLDETQKQGAAKGDAARAAETASAGGDGSTPASLPTRAGRPLYGLMAEFDSSDALVDKARQTYRAGYRRISAYSPFPVEGLADAIGLRPTRLPYLVLLGGIAGALGGYALQYYAAVVDYPLNIGGRPLNSWPAFTVVTFEMTILGAALVAALGMLLRNGLPQPYHAVFNAPRFHLASQDRFFLCVEARDPKFDLAQTRQFLESLGASEIVAVEV
ncbi:MAG: molybdopterin oxidoreductase [Chloroflexi bacterium]|nr:MAG: molybdopterin oxidoreductase [Chloroflexota bacterium]